MTLAEPMERTRSATMPATERTPLDMPARGVRDVPRTRPRERATLSVRIARVVAFGGALALGAGLTWGMAGAISGDAPWGLTTLFVALFAVTVLPVAFSATSAVAGLLHRSRAWREADPGRVALVMPVYNEEPSETAAGLLAMAEGLLERGLGDTFELVVISDTTDPGVWPRETAAIAWLRRELAGRMPLWYRRRPRNVARKSGNVEEFVRRAGQRYDAFVMLDADSLVDAATLETLARRMAGDPALGLLQTVPRLVGGVGPLPRAQDFAGAVFGPPMARGVAAWSGPDGNYWGHNAIIRTEAFAEACGLPELEGRAPFGGPILSHDFAEAAWMRRGGWSVRMDPDLGGSYESGPPTLLDLVVRDRRWMQGNFQHAGLVGASGLAGVSRFHFVNGIVGYLASPLWLAFLVVGAALTVVARRAEHRYFSEPFQLAPDWPRFDPARMLLVLVVTFGLLLLPKAIGLVQGVVRLAREQRGGAAVRLGFGAVLETLLSALYAPILMLTQTRQAIDVLRGRDSGWARQTRAGATPFSVALRAHAGHTLVGLATFLAGLRWAPELLPWASPVIAGLILSAPLSWWSGHARSGGWLGRVRILEAPDAHGELPPIVVARDRAVGRIARALEGVDLHALLANERLRTRHFEAVEPRRDLGRGQPDVALLSARAKCDDARTRTEFVEWLDRAERLALLGDPELAAEAARLPA